MARCSLSFCRSISSSRISVWLLMRSASMSSILGDADALGLLLGPDLGVADTDRGVRTLLLDRGELRGAPRLDVARLVDARVFKVAIDFDGALFGLDNP